MIDLPNHLSCTIGVIGLGYVGLPLALEFANAQTCIRTKQPFARKVIGLDTSKKRVEELHSGIDLTNEVEKDDLVKSSLHITSMESDLSEADVFVVTVPTPIDAAKRPDFTPLIRASASVGTALKHRLNKSNLVSPVVIFESTVYPGATEEVCVPVIEEYSGLKFNSDFFCGYSPERINPGDKQHNIRTIIKVTSGSTEATSLFVDLLYGSIINAGTYRAPSIKVAEASKVIENTQRDLNIALVNEFSIIFSKIGIDTLDVLEAASTKWNFLPFKPGLVGGHCIGVDPYYLTHKAEQVGYHPEIVLAGRRINDSMSHRSVQQFLKRMISQGINLNHCKILVLGLTFKEDCPDFRNSKVADIISELVDEYSIDVDVVDPCGNPDDAKRFFDISISSSIDTTRQYDGIILAVAHRDFKLLSQSTWQSIAKSNSVILDLKGVVPRNLNPMRL